MTTTLPDAHARASATEHTSAGTDKDASAGDGIARWDGLLCIGDPHLATRNPGFRKDAYPEVALGKLRWCLEHAAEHRLLPVLLGDLFHWPRENANWLLVELMELLPPKTLTVVGNHDCHENQLGPHDSLSVLHRAGRLHLLGQDGPWTGLVGEWPVCLGGTAWGQPLPEQVRWRDLVEGAAPHEAFVARMDVRDETPCVIWVTHHDVVFQGPVFPGFFEPHPIEGIDLVINGHIHRAEPDHVCGATTWINPGNITRLSRDEAIWHHTPAALRLELCGPRRWTKTRVPIPHAPPEAVFHPVEDDPQGYYMLHGESAFVRGLGELAARRTQTGAGLVYFLEQNASQLKPPVYDAICQLALEVLPDDHPFRFKHKPDG